MNYLSNGTVTSPLGFVAGAVAAGIKKSGKLDVALVVSEQNCTAAGVFTKNQVVAAPVVVDKETLQVNKVLVRGIVANAGNANACTGEPGLANARQMQKLAATALDCAPQQILLLSTGVIGVPLPMDKVASGIGAAGADLAREHGRLAAEAICTTDTFAKQAAVQVTLSGGTVTIGGMAKGAGMIHPNMATMLGVLTTDAAIDPDVLQGMLTAATEASFNRISVDGDTSTNDTVLLLANGASGVGIDRHQWEGGSDVALFSQALTHLCQHLAKLIVRDGEGATKLIELRVSGARTKNDAHQIANTIATSPLVKTALAGSDPNWGRIFAAAGRAGVPFDQAQTGLQVSNEGENWLTLLENGTPTGYAEADAAEIFAQPEIIVWLTLGEGLASDTVWTCDLTHDYVTINADYRT
jgi:glutamate N-acetyltransferase / amino-acid N-acetyltransferase